MEGENIGSLNLWLNVSGLVCWCVCFWWMHRISSKQNNLLDQLKEQGKRIENLSKIEHDLLQEVHPQVHEIKEGVTEVMETVKESVQKGQPGSD